MWPSCLAFAAAMLPCFAASLCFWSRCFALSDLSPMRSAWRKAGGGACREWDTPRSAPSSTGLRWGRGNPYRTVRNRTDAGATGPHTGGAGESSRAHRSTTWTPTPCSSSFSSCCSSAAAASSTAGVAHDRPPTPGLSRHAGRPRLAQEPHDRTQGGPDHGGSGQSGGGRSRSARGHRPIDDADRRPRQPAQYAVRPRRSRRITPGPSRSLDRLRGAPVVSGSHVTGS